MQLFKIPPDKLKVGMKIAVAVPCNHGYGKRTIYNIHVVSNITPNKTKITCGGYEYSTKNTTFYTPNEEMILENRRIGICKEVVDKNVRFRLLPFLRGFRWIFNKDNIHEGEFNRLAFWSKLF